MACVSRSCHAHPITSTAACRSSVLPFGHSPSEMVSRVPADRQGEPAPDSAASGPVLYCIRHGTSLHNVLFDREQTRDVYYAADFPTRDSPLMPAGHLEAAALGREWVRKAEVDVVFVSPLSRTLATLTGIWRAEAIISLSLYIYIYIYIYSTHVYIYIYLYMY